MSVEEVLALEAAQRDQLVGILEWASTVTVAIKVIITYLKMPLVVARSIHVNVLGWGRRDAIGVESSGHVRVHSQL
jgi:hypothetical protein